MGFPGLGLVREQDVMVTSRWGIAEPAGPGWQRAEIPGGTGKDKEDGEIRMERRGRGGKGNMTKRGREWREGRTGRERRVLRRMPQAPRKWSLPWQLQQESSIPWRMQSPSFVFT